MALSFRSDPTITCPRCFESFASTAVRFRCSNPRCTARSAVAAGAGVIPTIASEGLVFAAPAKSSLFGRSKPLTDARCPECQEKTTSRLCGSCQFALTHDAGLVDDKRIAIIGGRATGKSHYIATLVHKLEHEVGGNFNWSLRMIGDQTRNRFEDSFRGPLFRRKTVLGGTHAAATNEIVKTPMVFRLTFDRSTNKGAINFSFFDTAGEDMKSLTTMSTETKYITRTEGLIFLLDPLQIPAVRDQLPHVGGPAADPLSEPSYLVDRLCDLFESEGRLRPNTRVDTPVAFVLSKIDALASLLEPGSILRQPGEHFGVLQRREIDSIHTEVWSYLDRWIGSGFNSRIDKAFSRFRYFAVSALGSSPDAAGRIGTVAPLRVEDPFIWILSELGFIRAK